MNRIYYFLFALIMTAPTTASAETNDINRIMKTNNFSTLITEAVSKMSTAGQRLTPQQSESAKNTHNLGLDILIDPKKEVGKPARILYVVPLGPSDWGGLRNNDEIRKINDVDILPLSSEALGTILAEDKKNLQSKFEISRVDSISKQASIATITVSRGRSLEMLVRPKKLASGWIYIYLPNFYGDALYAVLNAAKTAKDAGNNGLILDLRGNFYGSAATCMLIASAFLPKGAVVFGEQGTRNDISVNEDGPFKDMPLKILTDSYSLFASKVFAQSLQNYRRATVFCSGQTSGNDTMLLDVPFSNTRYGAPITAFGHYVPCTEVPKVTPEMEISVLQQIVWPQMYSGRKKSDVPPDLLLEFATEDLLPNTGNNLLGTSGN